MSKKSVALTFALMNPPINCVITMANHQVIWSSPANELQIVRTKRYLHEIKQLFNECLVAFSQLLSF